MCTCTYCLGQKICGASAVGEVSGVARRLDFSTAGGADKNGTSPSGNGITDNSNYIHVSMCVCICG